MSFLPSPLDSEPASINDQFVEGLLSSHFCCLPCGKLDEGALLPLDYGNGANLTKLIKVTPAITQINIMVNDVLLWLSNYSLFIYGQPYLRSPSVTVSPRPPM